MLNKPLFRIPLRYGSIAALIGVALLATLFYMGWHPLLVPPFFDFRVLLFAVFFFFMLKELRDYYFNGLLFFWQGMGACLWFLLVFALIAAGLLLIFEHLQPAFVTQYISLLTEQIKTFPPEVIERIGKEAYQRNLDALPRTTAWQLATLYFWQSFVIGFFISIVISVILRRQPQLTNI